MGANRHAHSRDRRVPAAQSGARDQHRRDRQSQGQFAYALSGIDPNRSTTLPAKMMAKMHEYPGFLFVNSDLYNHTPNLQIDILRDQAKLYGVSETRILTLAARRLLAELRLPDQEADRPVSGDSGSRRMTKRSGPRISGCSTSRATTANAWFRLNAVTSWHPIIGPQAVNHINQFTSVTMFFNLKPGYAIGPPPSSSKDSEADSAAGVRGSLQGEALTSANTVRDLAILMVLAVFVMYVILAILYESYLHPITVLSSLPVALVGGLLTLWLFGAEASLYAFIGMFMLMGIVKKNGIMIVDFAQQRVRQGIDDDSGDPRRQHGPLPSHHDDHAGGADGRRADRAGLRRRWRFAPAAGSGGRRRTCRLAVHHAVRHAGDLSLSRRIPGEGAGPLFVLPRETRADTRAESGLRTAGRIWRLII